MAIFYHGRPSLRAPTSTRVVDLDTLRAVSARSAGIRSRVAAAAAVAAAAVLLAGCGVTLTSSEPEVPGPNTAGYTVLTGAVREPIVGASESAAPMWVGQGDGLSPPMSPEVPSSSGKWWFLNSVWTTFRRTQKVQLLASGGAPGVRFNLFWEESCGGERIGKRGVAGGTGGSGDVTLHTPALVLIKLPARYGTYDRCYLNATVSMHMKRWPAAKAAAPTIKIIRY
jgi:hypothetical protein